ncbi:lipocalin family protein [Gammaproteobacteria bacterium AB-CW1]|uniref:Lipocalin family protein n=1 Tax=Natronospira elongata TaxID=3110268 RepID=A0AAP6MKT3_9GAMM|nr:lipocalin family protein [Gammaproteobacteria bacterium AB-CW1]
MAARACEFELDLTLNPARPHVLQGDQGYSRKGPDPGNASRYFSYTRLDTQGLIHLDEEAHRGEGLGWMDREWGSSALSEEQTGWDWFSLQLSDGSDIMFYRLREENGQTSPFSKGLHVTPDGDTRLLTVNDVELDIQSHWQSPKTGVRYPLAWQLRIPELAPTLNIEPRLEAQEIDGTFRYWEGAMTVEGEREGQAIDGQGYLELAGY